MSWIEFSRAGISALVMLPPGQSFNRDLSVDNVLAKTIDRRVLGRPKWKACGTLLDFDDARPHLCNDESEVLGIRRIFHPSNSPDLALCHFWRSGDLEQGLEGQSFDDSMALRAGVSGILISMEVGIVRIFTEWRPRLRP
jgi:hypothetical protein